MRKTLLGLFALITCMSIAFGQQDIFYTRNATLTLNGKLNGEAIRLQATDLNVALNYETAEMIVRFPVNCLVSGVDSVNQILSRSNAEILFDSQMGIHYINAADTQNINFGMEGWLIVDGRKKTWVCGNGELHNLNNPNYESMFGMTMMLNMNDLDLDIPLDGLDENFEVILTQALLLRDKN